MTDQASSSILAAVDLGSNSFHMIVARVDEHNQLSKIDKLKEMVRLRGGLDQYNNLSADAEKRALACLQRFGDRIRDLPKNAVRIAGTNTLRMMKDSQHFLAKAKQALGHDVSIISGHEEARLIYLGVAHSIADDEGVQFVVDIGGGSTELILGQHFKSFQLESLNVGSVSITQKYFAEGCLEKKNWKIASIALQLEMMHLQKYFDKKQWNVSIGASGTIKAANRIIQELNLGRFAMDLEGLYIIRERMMDAGHLNHLVLPGLKADRAPVFAGGLAILIALFEVFNIDEMLISEGSLREGLLYDQIERRFDDNIRENTVKSMISRYAVDKEQGRLVANTAVYLFDQVKASWGLDDDDRKLLEWSAYLHEVGMSIEHTIYHKHSAYILQHSYMPGFPQRDQYWLSVLTKTHRKKLMTEAFDIFPDNERKSVLYCSLLLRLAVIFHRTRKPKRMEPKVTAYKHQLTLDFIHIKDSNMLLADLTREQKYWLQNKMKLAVI